MVGFQAFRDWEKNSTFSSNRRRKHVEEFLFTSSWVAEDLTVAIVYPPLTGTSVAPLRFPEHPRSTSITSEQDFAVHQLANDTGAWNDEKPHGPDGRPGGLLTTQMSGLRPRLTSNSTSSFGKPGRGCEPSSTTTEQLGSTKTSPSCRAAIRPRFPVEWPFSP